MSGLVLDCSVAIAWCFEDEASPETDAVLTLVQNDGAVVPFLFHIEIVSVLVNAERKSRITPSATAARLELMGALPIETETNRQSPQELAALARSAKLTAHDACYLDLAMRRRLPLATKDRELRQAAEMLGVQVLPEHP